MLRYARVFIAEKEPAIVAAMHHNAAGIYYEQDTPVIVPNWRDERSLSVALRSALDRFSFLDRNLRESKKTDWPAYIASKYRSVDQFERAYFRMSVLAQTEAGTHYDIRAQPKGEADILLLTTFRLGESDDEIGRKLLKLFDLCSTWDR